MEQKEPTMKPSFKKKNLHTSNPVISQILLQGCMEGGDSILTSANKMKNMPIKKNKMKNMGENSSKYSLKVTSQLNIKIRDTVLHSHSYKRSDNCSFKQQSELQTNY